MISNFKDRTVIDNDSRTPLHKAAEYGHEPKSPKSTKVKLLNEAFETLRQQTKKRDILILSTCKIPALGSFL